MANIRVRVLASERDLRDDFAEDATVADVVSRMFAAELTAGKRIRIVHGGNVRPHDTPLRHLVVAGRDVALHAVISAYHPPDADAGSTEREHEAYASAGTASDSSAGLRPHLRVRSPPQARLYAQLLAAQQHRAVLIPDDGLLDFGAIKVPPTVLLTGFFGAVVLCFWYMVTLYPAFCSKSSVGCLVALTAIYLIALSSQVRRLSRAQRAGASLPATATT